MSILPSPIPHPLDYCPWDLPGWVYEALDWVVGVEWPEGNERVVWDLADQWYAVAATLAGPHADAVTAASGVRSGYGGVGAVAEAFDTAWRKVAEGDEAPLPVLLAVSTDLGRLVEECGCDIEGAKLEVWIELGILVVELLALAVATVLTAGAASPAAAAAITATRIIVQQIFKRLMAQLARKALKQGLKEAGERAAKEVAKGGMKGLARRAARGGLEEAAEETGISLATQAYQNSTGRRHGLDVADLGMSALGGLAGGAVAPLAGLGRHATGRAARVGEHFGREMTGEVIAENAARLATGQGFTSLEDAARAAVSGARGSATGQADAALQARLDGRLSALAGASFAPTDLGGQVPPVVPGQDGDQSNSVRSAATAGEIPAQRTPPHVEGGSADGRTSSDLAGHIPPSTRDSLSSAEAVRRDDAVQAPERHTAASASETHSVETQSVTPVTQSAAESAALSTVAVEASAVPSVPSLAGDVAASSLHSSGPVQAAASPTLSAAAPLTGTPPTMTGGTGDVAVGAPPPTLGGAVSNASVPTPAPSVSTAPTPSTAAVVTPTSTVGVPNSAASTTPNAAAVSSLDTAGPVASGSRGSSVVTGPDNSPSPAPHRFPLLEALDPGPKPAPTHDAPTVVSAPADHALPPRPRTPEWYAAKWAADREALDRRRYQGYFQSQREWYEDKRRRERAAHLRLSASHYLDRARWFMLRARELDRAGFALRADHLVKSSRQAERDSYELTDFAEATLAGAVAPEAIAVESEADFRRINDDVGDLALGAVETSDRSALSRDDDPPPIDRSRRYGQWGGLRPPLALHQRDVERQVPREADGSVTRTADPRQGGWFQLVNDGGPRADPTRGINCLDCTLSLYETWMHGRPRVSAPRTFDAYAKGNIMAPLGGEAGGPGRVEDATGGRFQALCPSLKSEESQSSARHAVERAFANLHDQLLAGGHGSYAFLITPWDKGGSHAWVALNQNGKVLYLDPQNGEIADQPLYTHRGVRDGDNVIGIDALVIGGDGRPMPMAGLARGQYSARPDLPEYPPAPDDGGYGEPYINRMHLLEGPGSAGPSTDPLAVPRQSGGPDVPLRLDRGDKGPDELRESRIQAYAERVSLGLSPHDVVADCADLDAVLAAGVTPVEVAAELDAPTLRRLVPQLDDAAAHDVARLLGDSRIRQMLDDTWREPPQGKPLLAETLIKQLIQRIDLLRMILATPELLSALTARPMTLHHLARHQQAIDALGSVLDDIGERGAPAVVAEGVPAPLPTPLTAAQRQVSNEIVARKQPTLQSDFDSSKKQDDDYRAAYVRKLYADAEIAQRELNEVAVRVADECGRPGWRSEPKGLARVLDKLLEYENDASRLKDLAAAKVGFQRLDDLYQALRKLGQDPDVVILNIKDRFSRPQFSGYRDVLLSLRMSNGHVAELRLQLDALENVATWEHDLYEVRRDLEALAEGQGRPLTLKERAIHDGLLRRVQDAFWSALGANT